MPFQSHKKKRLPNPSRANLTQPELQWGKESTVLVMFRLVCSGHSIWVQVLVYLHTIQVRDGLSQSPVVAP